MTEIELIVDSICLLIFFYFLVVQSSYIMLLILAIPEIFKRYKETKFENFDRLLFSESAPQVSIIVPAYNEELCIVFTVNSLLHLSYRYKEIIIVNDGSSDRTLEILKKNFHLYPIPPGIPPALPTKKVHNYYRSADFPNLIVVDKENGGKIDANNAGINIASSSFFLVIDADTIMLDKSIEKLIRPFFMTKNMIASGGSIGCANGCTVKGNKIVKIGFPKKPILAFQVLEYLRAFLMARQGWNALGGCLLISGAFSLFDKKSVVETGGYYREIGDDFDMVVRLHKRMREKKIPYTIQLMPDLVAMTEMPFSIKSLINQRERWQRGIIATLWDYKKMMFNPKYGLPGLLGYPYFVLIEGISPIIETFGYILVAISYFFGFLNFYAAFWFLMLAIAFPILLTHFVILIQYVSFQWYTSLADTLKMMVYAIFEQMGFRQFLVFCRLSAFFKVVTSGNRWIKPKRKGFIES